MATNSVDTIFVLDENLKAMKVLTINGSNNFFDDTYEIDLNTGSESYEFSTNITDIDEDKYVMFHYHNQYKLFQIIDTEQEHNKGKVITTIYAEGACLELLNNVTRAFNGEYNIMAFISQLLEGTEWEIGEFSSSLEEKVVNVNIEKTTAIWSCLQDHMADFGYEINARVTYGNGHVKKKLIDVYAEGELGDKTYKRFQYGINVNGISKKKELYDWCTALIIEADCNVTEVEVSSGGYLKGKGSDTVLAISENSKYNNGKNYIYGVYEGKEKDPTLAVYNAIQSLKERSIPHFDYDVTTALTFDEYMSISVGDTVRVVDHEYTPSITLEARIAKLELSFTDRNNCKCTLSNYKELRSKIDLYNSMEEKDLTEADILAIKKYLMDLGYDQETIERILNNLLSNQDDPIEFLDTDDTENYKNIKLSTIDGGLWLGDKRVYDIKSQKVPQEDPSKNDSQYKDAAKYYSKFRLGSKRNDPYLAAVMSANNKWKIPTIVNYWSEKFGVDPRLVFAMIYQESSGNPNCDEAAYGLMQCEKSCYFGRTYKIQFLDGTTKKFTPSYSTMRPGSCGKITLNGVVVDKAVSNQVMFGCYELRKCAEACHYNIFATLMAYNFGPAGMQWCVCEYIKDKYGYTVNSNRRGISSQSSKVKAKYYEILDTYKAPFAAYRKKYKTRWGAGTPTNIELYLRYYKPKDGSLPYFKNKSGKKLGYGVNTPAGAKSAASATGASKSGNQVRNTIVKMAKTIVSQHVDQKIATYNQVPRTVNFHKPIRYRGTLRGIRNPIVYDCSSFVSCCYLEAGLKSVYDKRCSAGTLVRSATRKSGWKAWKCTQANLDKYAKPGDIIMDANYRVVDSKIQANPNYCTTHHTMIYIGNNKVAHASQWAYHPDAIKISNISYYINEGSAFILRPWDLAKADKNTTDTPSDDPIDNDDVSKIVIKGLPNAQSGHYQDLPNSITIGGITDNVKFPTSVKYVYCHFGIKDFSTNNYISLLKSLQVKYPNRPIFVAKEYHVNSNYENASTTNSKVDDFNSTMKSYCNKTKYVIFLDSTKDIVDTNGAILSSLSSDGYSMNDKAGAQKYYESVKKYILRIAKGQIITSEATSVNETLLPQKIYSYTKPVKSLKIKFPGATEYDYYTRITFPTASTITFSQPNDLYLSGDNCKKGAFLPSKNNRYTINIFRNTDNELTSKKYYGSVTSIYKSSTSKKIGYVNIPGGTLNVRKGSSTTYSILGTLADNTKVTIISQTSNGWYKIPYNNTYGYVSGKYIDGIEDIAGDDSVYTNYPDFKYRDKIVANAEGFLANKDNFAYNGLCAFDFSNPSANIDSWKTDGKIHLDDCFLMQLLTMGYSYDTMNLDNKTDRKKASNVSWALPYISSEGNLAKYFASQNWVLDDIDYENFSNVEPGDILFWDTDDVLNDEYMGTSHSTICVGTENGDKMMIGGSPSEIIKKLRIKDRSVNNLLFVGRIGLEK